MKTAGRILLMLGAGVAVYAVLAGRRISQGDEAPGDGFYIPGLSDLFGGFMQTSMGGSSMPGKFVESITKGRGVQYVQHIEAVGKSFGLPSLLLARVAYQESSFNPNARNAGSGALGMFQFMPATWAWIAPKAGVAGKPATDWQAAAKASAYYLSYLFKRFGTWKLALMAYNWGEGNVAKWQRGEKRIPTETQNYWSEILRDLGIDDSGRVAR